MDEIKRLIDEEQYWRKIALETKSLTAWNRANEALLEIMAKENEIELDSCELSNSMNV